MLFSNIAQVDYQFFLPYHYIQNGLLILCGFHKYFSLGTNTTEGHEFITVYSNGWYTFFAFSFLHILSPMFSGYAA